MSLMELSQVLGNFGEFFGAIAVGATLIYVAVQVRQAKEMAQGSAHATRAQGDMSLMTSVVDANTYNSAWEKVEAVDGSMNEYGDRLIADYGFSVPEAQNMMSFCFAWMKFQEHAFLSRITREDRRMHDAQIATWLGNPVFRKFWNDDSKGFLDLRFVGHVEEILKGREPR